MLMKLLRLLHTNNRVVCFLIYLNNVVIETTRRIPPEKEEKKRNSRDLSSGFEATFRGGECAKRNMPFPAKKQNPW